jgi:hypothetical protein
MNEMNALAELGSRLDPPSAHPPPELRHRVMTATRRRRLPLPRPGLPKPGLPKPGLPTLGLRLAAAGALAAVATGAVLAGQVIWVGDHPPAATAQAADVLRGAAAQAQRRPVVPVRDDQFVYVESITTSASFDEGAGGAPALESQQRRIWLSADGTHDGLVSTRPRDGSGDWTARPLPGCRDGAMEMRKGDRTVSVACEPTPGYHGDLPTDPGAMLTYLRGRGGSKNGPDQDAFTAAGDLIREAYLPPAVLAAVFEAVGRIPGVTVAGTATDEAGQTGVAVTRDEIQGSRVELIFDPETYDYLGERVVVRRDQDGLRAGQVLNSTAVLRVAVLPAAGRLP